MAGFIAGLWGLFGGFAVEGLELRTSLLRRGCWPWQSPNDGSDPEISAAAYLTGEIIRLIIGAGLAWAAASTGQISGPLGAVGIGAAAPMILDQFSRIGQQPLAARALNPGQQGESGENPGISRPDPHPRPDIQGQE